MMAVLPEYLKHKQELQASALYLHFKEELKDREAQNVCLSVLEWEYGWEGR